MGGGGSLAILLLFYYLVASIDFSPFMKISTRPSFAKAYWLLRFHQAAVLAHGFYSSVVAGCGTNTYTRLTPECKHSTTAEPPSPHTSPCAAGKAPT